MPRWRRVGKQRLRTWALFLLKKRTPSTWLPLPWGERYRRLISTDVVAKQSEASAVALTTGEAEFYCVMPSSAWRSKEWPATAYPALLKNLKGIPHILGKPSDVASERVIQLLRQQGIAHVDARGIALTELRSKLKQSKFILSVDTGLAHLAESLGTRALVIYGPTTPSLGFGVQREESVALGKDLGCRPCSKDGKFCYRFWDSHACLKRFTTDEVQTQIRQHFPEALRG